MASFARKLREARKRLGLKQEDLATQLHVSQTTISRWEKGQQEPDWRMMMSISQFLGVSSDFFLDDDEKLKAGTIDKPANTRRVDIVGAIQKDLWTDKVSWESEDWIEQQIPLVIPDGYAINGWIIKDNSGGPRFPKGSIVFSARYNGERFIPKPGDAIIFFLRDYERDLVEVAVREIVADRDGSVIIRAIDPSDDRLPMRISREDFYECQRSVSSLYNYGVVACVIASFIDEAPGRLPDPPRWPDEIPE